MGVEVRRVPHRLLPRRPWRLAVATGLAVLATASPAGADGPPVIFADTCQTVTLALVTESGVTRLKTTSDAQCAYIEVKGVTPGVKTAWTRFFTEPLTATDISTLCSISNPLVAGSQVEIAFQPGEPATWAPGGNAQIRSTGSGLVVHFLWSGSGGHIAGVGVFSASTCGVGSVWQGSLHVYDPDLGDPVAR